MSFPYLDIYLKKKKKDQIITSKRWLLWVTGHNDLWQNQALDKLTILVSRSVLCWFGSEHEIC